MKMIAAINNTYSLGSEGKLLYSIPEDMKFFREMTMGKVVVMGRTTFDSFPNRKPLKNRVNIVLSRSMDETNGIIVVKSFDELFEELKKYDTDDVFIIGGESVYSALIDKCDTVFLTKIDDDRMGDRHFPEINKMEEWVLESCSETKEHEGLRYTFNKYVR